MAPHGSGKTLEDKKDAISRRFAFGPRSDQLLLAGSLVAAVTIVVYLVLVVRQDDAVEWGRTSFVVATLVAAVAGAILARERTGAPVLARAAGLGVAVAALLTWGFLAVFSVGAPLFVAGLLILGGGQELLDEDGPRRVTAAASLVTLAILLLGLSLS